MLFDREGLSDIPARGLRFTHKRLARTGVCWNISTVSWTFTGFEEFAQKIFNRRRQILREGSPEHEQP